MTTSPPREAEPTSTAHRSPAPSGGRTDGPKLSEAEANRAFSRSIVISGIRCVFTYLIFPFVAPAVGVAKSVGPWIGIPLGLVAILFNVLSIRRFWASDHRYKWHFTVISATVVAMLTVMIVIDVAELLQS